MTFYFRKLYNIYIMSNYSLQVDNSRLYDPSLRSAISSLNQRQEEAHRLADAAYGEMSAKANMLEQLANDVQGKDSVAYQNYMNYANALRQHTNMLATQGLNPSTWNNIIKAKNDYSRIISPIENAMKKREEAAKYQAEYIKQHPDAIFEREAGEMGIDQWMKNPNYVPKVIDRRALEERAKERYSALNKQLMEWVSKNGGLDAIKTKDPQAVKKWFKVNVPWLYESMYKTGVNPDDLEKLAAGDPSMQNSLLGAILNDTVRSSGVLSMNTSYDHFTDAQNRQRYQNILDKVMSSVRGASSHSIGETKFDKYDDRISADLLKQSKELAFRAAEAEKDRKWKEGQAAIAANGGRNSNKLDTYYYHEDAFNVNPEAKTTEAANLQNVLKLININKEFANYDADDIIDVAKKTFGKDWGTLIASPHADKIILEALGRNKSYSNAGMNDKSGNNARTIRIIENAKKYSDVNTHNVNTRKVNEIVNKIKNAPKNNDGTINYGKIDLSGYSDAELLAASDKFTNKTQIANITQSPNGSRVLGATNGTSNIYKSYTPESNAIGFEISRRIQNDTWDNGVSPTEMRLRKLINYDPNKIYSLNAQTDQYIGNSALSLKGFSSNYANGSDKVHTTEVLKRAQSRQAQDNGAGNKRLSGIYDEQGNYLDVNNGEDLKKLIGSDDIFKPNHLINIKLIPQKDGTILKYFVGKDGKRYFMDDGLVTDGAKKRKSHEKALSESMIKILNASPNTILKNKFGENYTIEDARNELRTIYPNFDNLTNAEKENLIDEYLDSRMQDALKDDFKAYEDNGGQWFLNYFENTHNVNSMDDIDNTETNTNLYNPYLIK